MDRARCGVVKAQHPGTVTRSCRPPRPARPGSPTSRPSTASRIVGPRPGTRRAPTGSTRGATRDAGLLHRHPPADGVGVAAHGIGLRLRADRRRRPLPAHAGLEGLLPHGVGRQRPADRAPGADLLRRDLRPVAALRPRLRAAGGTGPGGHPGQPAQLHRAVPPADGRRRARLRGTVAPHRALGRLGPRLRHHRRPEPAGEPAHVPAQPGPGRGLLLRGADAVGRRLPDRRGAGRDGGPRAARRLLPAALRRHRDRDHAARAGRRLRGAGRPPRRRALRAALRDDGAHAALRGGGADPRPPPGRAGQGLGHRDDLHLRRRHRRRVVARARPAHPQHPHPHGPHHRDAPARRSRRRGMAGHRRPHGEAGPAGHGRDAGGVGRHGRRAPGHHASGQVLRAGRAPTRDRDQPAVVHPQRRARRGAAPVAPRPGQGARLAPALHAGPLRRLGERPQQRLAREPPALLRRAHPDLVPDRRRRRARPRVAPRARRGPPAGRSHDRHAPRLHRGAARRPGRLRRRPRRHGHVGHLVAHPADRLRVGGRPDAVRGHLSDGPAAPGLRDHPHVALLHHLAHPPGAPRRALAPHHPQRLGPRPRAQEDVQVQGQRGHTDAAGGRVRFRRRALLGLQRPARHRHRGRHRRHEDRPPPGHQDPQRVEVRAGPPR